MTIEEMRAEVARWTAERTALEDQYSSKAMSLKANIENFALRIRLAEEKAHVAKLQAHQAAQEREWIKGEDDRTPKAERVYDRALDAQIDAE